MTEPPQAPTAGWYPDPEQAQTQRYWDGENWTDQRAPLPPPSQGSDLTIGLMVAFVGAIVAIIGTFLPYVDSPTVLHIAGDTLVQGGGTGIFVIGLAVASAATAFKKRRSQAGVDWGLIILGALIIGVAVYAGTGSRLALETNLGQTVQGSAGIGVWAVGIGGGLIGLSGLRRD